MSSYPARCREIQVAPSATLSYTGCTTKPAIPAKSGCYGNSSPTRNRFGRRARIAGVLPNPAIQSNYLYLFAAEGCDKAGEPRPDPFERIEVVERPLEEIPELIRRGEIAHSMVITALAFMGLVPQVVRPATKAGR